MNPIRSKILLAAAVIALLALGSAPAVKAGCGCSKLPPELASVRPHATYAGSDVTLFHPSIQAGATYDVTFTSGTANSAATVQGVGVIQRDLADAQNKPQIVVPLPAIALGPTSVSVTPQNGGAPLLALDDSLLTTIPGPIALPETVGAATFPSFNAAVSRSGVAYFSLDLTDTTKPRVFEAQLQGYPVRFDSQDVLFYNSQGFLMQELNESMPGLFAIHGASSASNSDILRYSRHEFSTYFLQHEERQTHAVDPTDPRWHADGTPHIDHNHMIVALMGTLPNGASLSPGSTPSFDLVVETHSLFENAMYGEDDLDLENRTVTDSHNSAGTGTSGRGDVASGRNLTLEDDAILRGDAKAPGTINVWENAEVDGETVGTAQPMQLLPVDVPSNIEDLGNLTITSGTHTLTRGSYRASKLYIKYGGKLFIDNSEGPVTLYVEGQVYINGQGVEVADEAPEKFSLYVADDYYEVKIKGSAEFHGVLYAPTSAVRIDDQAVVYGSVTAWEIDLEDDAIFIYDTALRGEGLTD